VNPDRNPDRADPAAVLAAARSLWKKAAIGVALFSAGVNLLMLTTPLYMLQVYDRVITTRNVDTLVALTVIAVVALAALGGFEMVRGRIFARLDTWLDRHLSEPLLAICLDSTSARREHAARALRDLETVRAVVGGGTLAPLFDAPWIPVYLGILFLVDPLLGLVAVLGGMALVGLAVLNDRLTRPLVYAAGATGAVRLQRADTATANADVIAAMGLAPNLLARWRRDGETMLCLHARAGDRAGAIGAAAKVLRLMLQIAILGVGAALVIDEGGQPGIIVAAAVLMGRALAPAEQLIGAWRALIAAYAGYRRIGAELGREPRRVAAMALPRPSGALAAEQLTYAPPNAPRPILDNVDFALAAGETLGVIGPSAAGKTTLSRLLVGCLRPTAGAVRFDDADIAGWDPADRGRHVGYLPQDVALFDGTVRDNIARLGEADGADVIAAARIAGVHRLILRLPQGYDTVLGAGGIALSGGQRQRVGLARAVYGRPSVIVLDEPNANLDTEGEQALVEAMARLKEAGATLVVIAHRMNILVHTDRILMLDHGRVELFGARDEVMPELTRLTAVSGRRSMDSLS
jgi:PrtD family type I secretion system ABC transporter